MPDMNNSNNKSVYLNDTDLYNKKINPVPVPEKSIGIDTDKKFYENILDAGLSSTLDTAKINSFSQISQRRDLLMQTLDTMAEDPTIAAALEIYAEDATEMNDKSLIMWCESADPNINKYITYLLDSLNVDKNIYKWTYSLCKYGDLYLRLYRESDVRDSLFDEEDKKDNKKKSLNEDIILKAYNNNDAFIHYIEMESNPAELFELTKFGKTYAYIKANVTTNSSKVEDIYTNYYKYSFKRSDVELYDATTFVHASLEDNVTRYQEEIELFLNKDGVENNNDTKLTYKVKKGQSILYNTFKIWREMMLLENSMLLNRLTKSSITRIIGVEVGDMAKESIGPHLMKIKGLIEQKTAFDTNNSMEEYTNPGPIENNVYVPTRNGIGNLTTNEIGGDANVTGLSDVDYFSNKLYSCLRSGTVLKLFNGSEVEVQELFRNFSKYQNESLISLNSNNEFEEAKILNVSETEIKKEFIRLEFEDGTYIEVTPEHRILLCDGTYKQAKELNEEDELMYI